MKSNNIHKPFSLILKSNCHFPVSRYRSKSGCSLLVLLFYSYSSYLPEKRNILPSEDVFGISGQKVKAACHAFSGFHTIPEIKEACAFVYGCLPLFLVLKALKSEMGCFQSMPGNHLHCLLNSAHP